MNCRHDDTTLHKNLPIYNVTLWGEVKNHRYSVLGMYILYQNLPPPVCTMSLSYLVGTTSPLAVIHADVKDILLIIPQCVEAHIYTSGHLGT